MRASLEALPAFEVAVRRRCATLAWRQLVGVHAKAHRATRLAPLETGFQEDLVEAFLLGLFLDETGARDDLCVIKVVGDFLAFDDFGDRAQIFDPAVGARTDPGDVDGMSVTLVFAVSPI